MSSFKVVIIGGETVGKTSLVKRILRNNVNPNEEPTVAVKAQDLKVTIQSLGTDVNLELYDLPGQERYMILNRMYLRDTNAAIIVYDVSNRESIQRAESWIQELKETAPE
jgi:small GTP-binding protein